LCGFFWGTRCLADIRLVHDPVAPLDAHLASEHFKRFDAAVAPMLVSKTVRLLERAVP